MNYAEKLRDPKMQQIIMKAYFNKGKEDFNE
jgi:hypothetical protein